MLTKTDNTTLSFATDPAEISRRLQEPFASSEVKFRIGARNRDKTKGIALAYIDARNVQNRLDEVVGCANWKLEFVELPDAIKCRLSLRINGEWITKEDVSSIERVGENAGADAVDMAKKGDHSDAFKRAAVQWGIGRYLYGYDSGWLELKNEGRYFAQQPRLPDHMLPAHERKSANKPAPRVAKQEAPAAANTRPAAETTGKTNTAESASPSEQKPAAQFTEARAAKLFGDRWATLPEKHQRATVHLINEILAGRGDEVERILSEDWGRALADFLKDELRAGIARYKERATAAAA